MVDAELVVGFRRVVDLDAIEHDEHVLRREAAHADLRVLTDAARAGDRNARHALKRVVEGHQLLQFDLFGVENADGVAKLFDRRRRARRRNNDFIDDRIRAVSGLRAEAHDQRAESSARAQKPAIGETRFHDQPQELLIPTGAVFKGGRRS